MYAKTKKQKTKTELENEENMIIIIMTLKKKNVKNEYKKPKLFLREKLLLIAVDT